MKRLLLILAVAMMAVACEGPQGPQGPAGRDGRDGELIGEWFTVTVKADEWEPVDDEYGNFLYFQHHRVGVTYITNNVCNNGIAIGTTVVPSGKVNIQQVMPVIIPFEDNTGKLYTKQLSFDYSPDELIFYVHYSDFREVNPGTITFRIMTID